MSNYVPLYVDNFFYALQNALGTADLSFETNYDFFEMFWPGS